jgi:hypothetical protein
MRANHKATGYRRLQAPGQVDRIQNSKILKSEFSVRLNFSYAYYRDDGSGRFPKRLNKNYVKANTDEKINCLKTLSFLKQIS